MEDADIRAAIDRQDRFRDVTPIRQGGMAVVWSAFMRSNDRKVAIKTIRPGMVTSQAIERFKREYELHRSLEHPNIVPILEFNQESGIWLLVMEFVEGRTLAEWSKCSRPLNLRRAVDYIAQVAEAIAFVHRKGITHRDLTPSNIMVVDHTVKVLDFGIARSDSTARVTATGQGLGTPGFIAWEQRKDAKSATAQSDIFSIGCMLYYLLLQSEPELHPDDEDAGRQWLITHVSRMRAKYPRGLCDILRRTCAWDPKDRYKSIEQLRDDLQSCVKADDSAYSFSSMIPESPPTGSDAADADQPTALEFDGIVSNIGECVIEGRLTVFLGSCDCYDDRRSANRTDGAAVTGSTLESILALLATLRAEHYITTTDGKQFHRIYEQIHGPDSLHLVSGDDGVVTASERGSKAVLVSLDDRTSPAALGLRHSYVNVITSQSHLLFVGYDATTLQELIKGISGVVACARSFKRFALLSARPTDDHDKLRELCIEPIVKGSGPPCDIVAFLRQVWERVVYSRTDKGIDDLVLQR